MALSILGPSVPSRTKAEQPALRPVFSMPLERSVGDAALYQLHDPGCGEQQHGNCQTVSRHRGRCGHFATPPNTAAPVTRLKRCSALLIAADTLRAETRGTLARVTTRFTKTLVHRGRGWCVRRGQGRRCGRRAGRSGSWCRRRRRHTDISHTDPRPELIALEIRIAFAAQATRRVGSVTKESVDAVATTALGGHPGWNDDRRRRANQHCRQ